MRRLRLPLFLFVLCLITGVANAADARPLPIEITMAATVAQAATNPTQIQSFLSLRSLDGLPHSMVIQVPDTATLDANPWTYRAWWMTEQPVAEALQQALRQEQGRVIQLDQQRWLAIGAFAPALWPVAAGYGSILAHPQSAAGGMEPYELPLPLLFSPIPEAEVGALQVELDMQAPREALIRVNPMPIPTKLSSLGLRLSGRMADVHQIEVLQLDDVPLDPPLLLPVRLDMRYALPASVDALKDDLGLSHPRWHPSGIAQMGLLISAWNSDATDSLITTALPEHAQMRYAGGAPSDDRIDLTSADIPTWWTGSLILWLGLIIYLGAGWILAPPRAPIGVPERLGGILLGWSAGWVVAVLGFPILGLGFFAGGVVTGAVWARAGLGEPGWRQWAGIIATWLLLSLLAWPLLLTQGTLI